MSRSAQFDDRIPPAVNAALGDTARICPMPAGPGLLQGNALQLRLPEGELAISAPARLIKKVFALCDGSTTFDDILLRLPAPQREEFSRFMEFLLNQGALIDAVLITRQAAIFGHQTTTVGLNAPNALTAQLARRFTPGDMPAEWSTHTIDHAPLDEFFARRASTYTFANREIAPATLHTLLWSASGISEFPRRTVASAGGMHLLNWRLILQRAVGEHPPGVYEIAFPATRKLALKRITSDIHTLPRCFHKPWQLGAATGVLVALADAHIAGLRYRNRAVQYLFLEAGAAAHNLCLTAPALGLACAQIGGYSDEHLATLCQAGRQMVLGSVIFGAAPTPEDRDAANRAHPIEFVWADSPNDTYRLPFFIARARPQGVTDDSRNTWGRDADPRLAYIKAHAEAVERDGMAAPRDIVQARLDELPRAIHPADITRYSSAQYRRADFPYTPFDPAARYPWREGVSLVSGDKVWVPAHYIHGAAASSTGSGALMQSNSSGCAAGPGMEAATLAALLELIERDAFMRHWLTQTPGQGVTATQLPRELQSRIRQLREVGCSVTVSRLDSPFAPVMLTAATHQERHFTCVGAAARDNPLEAIGAALDELETTVYTRLLGQDSERLTPQAVRTPEHHTLLYAQAAYYRRAAKVLTPVTRLPASALLNGAKGSASSLARLTDKMQSAQVLPCVVDITPALCHIDQGRIRIHVVKAVAPGLVPIAFGSGLEPRGMLSNPDPASRFPHPFP